MLDASITGRELWKSNGTEGGTVLVRDIRPEVSYYGYPFSSFPTQLVNAGGGARIVTFSGWPHR